MITNIFFFWSLAVNRYQKQSHLMTIFVARGQGMKLIMNGKSIAKKMKILKILSKTHVMYLKRKPKTCKNQIQVEKVWFFWKNQFFRLWCLKGKNFLFLIFRNFQNSFLKNGFHGTYWMLKGKKSRNLSSFVASTVESQGIVYKCGHKVPAPM